MKSILVYSRPLAEHGRKIIEGESQPGKKKRTCWTYERSPFDHLEAWRDLLLQIEET